VAVTQYFVVSNTQIVATVLGSSLKASGSNAIAITDNAVTNTVGTSLTSLAAPTVSGSTALTITDGPLTGARFGLKDLPTMFAFHRPGQPLRGYAQHVLAMGTPGLHHLCHGDWPL